MPAAGQGRFLAMRRDRGIQLLFVALGITAVPIVILGIIATQHVRRIERDLSQREARVLMQSARAVARNLTTRISEEELQALGFLDLESEETLALSFEILEAALPGTVCFALLDDDTFLYPFIGGDVDTMAAEELAELAMLTLTRATTIKQIHTRRQLLRGKLYGEGRSKVFFPYARPRFAASVHRLSVGSSDGLIGFCWGADQIRDWCTSAATDLVPTETTVTVTDRLGNSVTDDGHVEKERSSTPTYEAAHALEAGSFPWVVRARAVDPTAVAESIRSQERLYTAALVLICLVLAAGVAMLVGITWREVELGQIKADFAANVSHELLTPVALIRSSAEALVSRDNIAQDRMQRYLGIIGRESRRLTDLMNTVLRFSKAQRKDQAYHRVSIDLAGLLREFLEDYAPRLRDENFSLTQDIPATPVPASLDKDAMHVVFANLVENAIKFSEDRRSLHVALGMHHGQIRLVFEDQGIGIDQQDHPHIFESFYRGEHNLVKKTRGTGIGLTLARDIVRAHGGHIAARSVPRKGSTFTITLPSTG